MAFNDNIAIGAIQAARARGLRVPEDLSVVGFDDVEYATIVTPALTTVRQPLAEMGRTAVSLLGRLLEGQRLRRCMSSWRRAWSSATRPLPRQIRPRRNPVVPVISGNGERNGNGNAFAVKRAGRRLDELFDAQGASILHLCRLILRDPIEAEDAAQQTFLSAYRALLRGTTPREPDAWLAQIARNECRARLRRRELAAVPLEVEAEEARDDSGRGGGARTASGRRLRHPGASYPPAPGGCPQRPARALEQRGRAGDVAGPGDC